MQFFRVANWISLTTLRDVEASKLVAFSSFGVNFLHLKNAKFVSVPPPP